MAIRLTPDQYLQHVINRYVPTQSQRLMVMKAYTDLSRLLKQWANVYLMGIRPSGSFAKGTAIRGDTDLDIFVSLKRDAPGSLGDLYYHLDAFLKGHGLITQLRNVSVRVSYSGLAVDIVPGRMQHAVGGPHSLFSRKSGTWVLTNVDSHVQMVKQSPCKRPILLTKIWRQLRALDFPSFYLELAVIEVLKGKPPFRLPQNMLAVLAFLARDLENRRIVDPANSNNIISDELSSTEKRQISMAAVASLQTPDWAHVVW